MKKYFTAIFLTIITALTIISCATDGVSPEPVGQSAIPQDEAVLQGRLENGLTYYIRENARPANKAELRLVVNAGSVLEDEDQRGLAHFLEHMAFNGTEKYPENELVSFLQEIGMEFGPDINAYTSFDETVYMLSVPTDREGLLSQGFEVLEEWAFNMTIDREEVVKERGVILEEWRLGRGANQRILDRILPVLFADSRYAVRLPIGIEEIIVSADRQRLERFYRDWYRPELMAIVAVGDFSAEDVERQIIERFSSYSNPDSPRERERFDVPRQDEPLFAFESDPESSVASVEILNRYDAAELRQPEDYKELLVDSLFYSMINSRLSEIAQREDPPFLTASAYQSSYTRWTTHSGITALVSPSGISRGLEAISAEYARISQHGFLESELDRSRRNLLSGFESFWKDRDNRESASFLGSIQEAYLTGTPLPDIDWEWEQAQRWLPEIQLGDFAELIETRLADDDRIVIVSGPEEINRFPLSAEEARLIFATALASNQNPWTEELADGVLVENPPAAGQIISEDYDENAGIYSWSLSNGARVYVKPTDFKEDEILFSAFSPGGLSLVSDDEYVSGSLASTIAQISGVGQYSLVDLNKLLAGINVSISPYISEYEEGVSGSATPADLQTLLELNYLFFTSPRRDDSAWNSYSGRLAEFLRNQELDPRYQYQNRINEVLYEDHPRSRNLRPEDVAEVDLTSAIEIYRQRFADGGDFSFVFTGNVDLELLRPLVEQWIGGLPATGSNESPGDNGMDYFAEDIRSELRRGIETASIVTQVWHGDVEWSYDNLYDMAALSAALDILLIEEVREAAGGTYSIYSTFSIDNVPDEDYRFIVQFSSEPARVDELIGLVNGIIERIAEEGIDPDYAAKVSESQRINFRENLERNGWWSSQMKFLITQDLGWNYATDKLEWYDNLTADDLSSSLRRWLTDATYGEIILYPEDFE